MMPCADMRGLADTRPLFSILTLPLTLLLLDVVCGGICGDCTVTGESSCGEFILCEILSFKWLAGSC
jgi:hypothetical protein